MTKTPLENMLEKEFYRWKDTAYSISYLLISVSVDKVGVEINDRLSNYKERIIIDRREFETFYKYVDSKTIYP